jgi:hypothetical protein
MLDRRYLPASIWIVAVTAAMAWPIFAPPVAPRGVAFRDDTMSVEMFDMTGENYAAILGAVERGSLVSTDLQDGFKAFTPARLNKGQLAGRVTVARDIVERYIATQRTAARLPLLGIWAALALLLPGLYFGGRALLGRKSQPLTAPPVRPEMM